VKVRSAQLLLSAVCLIFGVLLMVQFRTQGKIAKQLVAESSADQAQIIANLYDANVALRKEVDGLARQVRENDETSGAARAAQLAADLRKFRIVNGSVAAIGPGVEISVEADLRPEDVQDLINELRNAGAEALALNGQRLTVRSAVTSDHGAIVVNDRKLIAPYVFSAVGAPDTLERALTRKGGLVSYLQTTYPEGHFSVSKSDKLTLPVAETTTAFQVAVPDNRAG
jgi:uncharacterized protein YlxW (UPF0749 family)